MKLRLYHHPDGARIAYREAGTGPPLALLHSKGLSHREFEPVVDELSHRHRVVLPDLPLHGDSEDRPRHPYTPEWLTAVLAGFLHETCGPRPFVAGHGVGAQLALRAVARGALDARAARAAAEPDARATGGRRVSSGPAASSSAAPWCPAATACWRAPARSCCARAAATDSRRPAPTARATSSATR